MENGELGGIGKYLLEEDRARELLERIRWPDGPICPHCVVSGGHYRVKPRRGSRSPVRPGVWKCKDCRKQFSVTVGTVFHGSKIPLGKWLIAIYWILSSDKGMNAHQLHRRLGITYKSSRLMVQRIQVAIRQGPLAKKLSSALEAERGSVSGKRREEGGSRVEGKTPVSRAVGIQGGVGESVMARLRIGNLKEFTKKTWRKLARA